MKVSDDVEALLVEHEPVLVSMREDLNRFIGGLEETHRLGIPVRHVFAYCGIEVPSYAAPLLERALAKGVARADEIAESAA